LALTLLGIAVLLITLEKYSRRKQKQYQQGIYHSRQLVQLSGIKNWGAFIICATPFLIGFLIPASILITYSIRYYRLSLEASVMSHALTSLLLSSGAAILATSIGIFIAYAKRLKIGGRLGAWLIETTGFGYGFPGAVLAVGLIMPLASFDNMVDLWMEGNFGIRTGLLLTGTVFTVIYAYIVRFLVISKGSVEASLNLITPSMDMAAQNLGVGPFKRLVRIHLPLMKGGVFTGMILIFVDCMKELPATLILRPFGLETLATFVYQYTSDELLKESAFAALLIVITGLLPVIFLSKSMNR
jgi:iron(III) transport system permease protein